jgi:hypothetical protein
MYGYQDKIRYLLLGSVFIFVSIITSAKAANAEGEPILGFNNSNTCTVDNVKDGNLAVNIDNNTLSSTSPGKPGIISIDCGGSATVTISKPVPNGGTGTTDFTASGNTLSATAKSKSTVLGLNISNPGNPTQVIGSVEESDDPIEIEVDMEAKKGSGVISAGEYKFIVNLTITPQ